MIKPILQKVVNEVDFSNIGISIGNASYTGKFTTDSKLLSKIIEIHTIQELRRHMPAPYVVTENPCQTSYPDMMVHNTLTDEKVAVDIKSSYITNKTKNAFRGFTLGTYNGYFKNRKHTKNIMYPYDDFTHHLCICFIYNRDDDLYIEHNIVCEKWRIASKCTGSGNTCNIGSTRSITDLLNNETSPCVFKSQEEFDAFWMNK